MARPLDRAGDQPQLRRSGVRRLGRHRRRPVCPAARTTSCFPPLPASWSSDRCLRSGSTKRAGASTEGRPVSSAEHDLRQAGIRRPDPVHRRAAVLLMLLWMRAAVIIYALFFGLLPFPGLDHIAPMLFTTPTGWAMLIVGTAVGALFAAFSFAISAFSIPMLLDEAHGCPDGDGHQHGAGLEQSAGHADLGRDRAGAVFLLSLATGLFGLIVVFPAAGTRNLACLRRSPSSASQST